MLIFNVLNAKNPILEGEKTVHKL